MFVYNLLVCILFSISLVFSSDDIHIISLGENCRVTDVLISHHLKQYSYPFEWNITSFKALYRCLIDEFFDFTNPEYFTPYFDQRSPVNKYGIVLAHNFPVVVTGVDSEGREQTAIDPNWRFFLPEVQEKYRRRIDRFREACLSGKKVFFIRYAGTLKEEAQQLVKLLRLLYPELNFTILCINHGIENVLWNIPYVKNYIINTSSDWSISERDQWKAIFIDAGLLH